MAKGVYKVDDLGKAIIERFKDYQEDVHVGINEVTEEAAKVAVRLLKAESPKRKTAKGGTYAKGWRASEVKGRWIVHNKTSYRLTHLLEKGHTEIDGVKRVPAHPHIAPIEQKIVKKYVSDILDVVKE